MTISNVDQCDFVVCEGRGRYAADRSNWQSRCGINMNRTTHQIMTAVIVLLYIIGWAERLGAAENDQLSVLGARATEGAAAGYVEDHVCARCHAQIYESYQHVGMAQSFHRAGAAARMEDFGRE